MEQHVIMTEELAERMSPEKGEGENDVLERNKILEGIAEVSMHQGQYHIATKKFTQAGNKVKVSLICDVCDSLHVVEFHFILAFLIYVIR